MRLSLENSSGTPVNFIKLSFEDNTMREASAVLAEEITPRHAYEIQHDQLHRPVMRWDAEQAVDIKPGARASVAVECFGKIGWYVPSLLFCSRLGGLMYQHGRNHSY
jgi:hypothetical protein